MRALLASAMLCCTAAAAVAEEAPAAAWPQWLAPLRVRGRLAEEFAYRLHDPGDVSKLKTLGWLDAKYTFSESASLRLAGRGWYDAVFEATDRYPANVEHDQKTDFSLREALLTLSGRSLDVRAGRQQIVWGEAISNFVTDVVNPKDFREFILPDFSEVRLPIWALDVTYRFTEGISLEGVWTPDTRFNKNPKQGAEFEFTPIAYRFRNPVVRLPDDQDEFSLGRSEGGARLSVLRNGWDISLIYYDQADKQAVLFQRRVRQPVGPDVIVLDPRHPRLHIIGATLGKSVEPAVIRGEIALTVGKRYETSNPLDGDGVVRRDTIDYLIGVDYTFFGELDAALQVSQKILTGSATNLTRPNVAAQVSTQIALRLTTGFLDNTLNVSLLSVVGVNRADVRLSPRIDYLLTGAVTLSVGADIFEGPRSTLYGQFDPNDRVTFTTTWRF